MIKRHVKLFASKTEFSQETVDCADFPTILQIETDRLIKRAERFMLEKGYCRTREVRISEARDVIVGGCNEDCGFCGNHEQYIIPFMLIAKTRGYYIGKKKVLQLPVDEGMGSTTTICIWGRNDI